MTNVIIYSSKFDQDSLTNSFSLCLYSGLSREQDVWKLGSTCFIFLSGDADDCNSFLSLDLQGVLNENPIFKFLHLSQHEEREG